jgi:hypothetical protein
MIIAIQNDIGNLILYKFFLKFYSIKGYMGSIEEKGGLCYAIGMIFDN